jgi:hypothetical protein
MHESVNFSDSTLAVILPTNFQDAGIKFFTPDEFPQQLGYMNRPQGHVIPPHVHNVVVSKVESSNGIGHPLKPTSTIISDFGLTAHLCPDGKAYGGKFQCH